MTQQIRSTRRVVFHGMSALGVAGVLAGCGSDDSGGTGDSGADASPTEAGSPTGGGNQGGGGGGGAQPLAQTSEVPVGGGLILTDEKIVLTQPSAGEFLAFSAVCTHQGCVVSDVSDEISCGCHGSTFALDDGSPTGGPAPSPLPTVEITVQGDGIFAA